MIHKKNQAGSSQSDPEIFPSAKESIAMLHESQPDSSALTGNQEQLAFLDKSFLLKRELRGMRLQLELQKAEMKLADSQIQSTIIFLGSARIPAPEKNKDSLTTGSYKLIPYYRAAVDLAKKITRVSAMTNYHQWVVTTGGGGGIMEAGNRGASEVGGPSVALNIVLPHEDQPNPYVTSELSFRFHYFAIRKMHFLMRARAVLAFPGGFGTLDEVFEVLTLMQTGKARHKPIILFGTKFWQETINWQSLVDQGLIHADDIKLLHFTDSVDQAMAILHQTVFDPFLSGENAST